VSYVLTIRTRDTAVPKRFELSRFLGSTGRTNPTEFQIVFESREAATEAYETAKRKRKPGDEIELMSHELIGSV